MLFCSLTEHLFSGSALVAKQFLRVVREAVDWQPEKLTLTLVLEPGLVDRTLTRQAKQLLFGG